MNTHSPSHSRIRDQYSPQDGSLFYRCVMGDGSPAIHYGLYLSDDTTMRQATEAATLQLLQIARSLCDENFPREVVDLGAGSGGSAHLLARQTGAAITCVDLCAHLNAENRSLAASLDLGGHIHTWTGPFDALPKSWGGRFDWVWSQEAICHADHKRPVFLEARRILRPGGLFVFSDILLAEDASPADCAAFTGVNAVTHLATATRHLADLRRTGFTGATFHDWSEHLPANFARMLDQIKTHRLRLLAEGVNSARIDDFENSLQTRLAWPAGSVMRWGAFTCRTPTSHAAPQFRAAR